MKKQKLRRLLCAACALAMLLCTLFPASALAAGETDGAAEETLTVADAQQMQQADAAVTALTDSVEYEAMTAAERSDAAVAQLEELVQQGLVRKNSIYVDEENGMVSYTYRCGALGGVMLEEPDDKELETLELDGENGIVEASGSRYEFLGNAMIYYAFDDMISSSRYPYYAYMQAFWTTRGLTTKLNTNVTVLDLRMMYNYDLCILSAHGAYYTYSTGYFTHTLRTEPIILLLEESSTFHDMVYGMDLLTHRVIKVNGRYCVTPDFFRNTYSNGQLNGTIVLSETCEFLGVDGSEDISMAEALLAGGASAVFGYVNNVYTVYSRSVMWDMVNRLILGRTVRQAFDHAMRAYGSDDLVWYLSRGGRKPHAKAAYAVLLGNENASLYSAGAAAAA